MAGTYLGQNFLVDKKYILKIVKAIKDSADKYLDKKIGLEVGPGKGAITKYLSNFFEKLILFEKDESMKPYLEKLEGNIEIIFGDFLQQDLSSILEQRGIKEAIIFGNLPYYITSPIFRKVVENQKYFPVGVFMIQKEVADKIKTNAEKKSYLWWLVNYYYKVEYLFSVPPKAFRPAPKVVSAVVRLVRRNKFPDIDYDKMVYWLDMISGYKRKTLGKIFKILVKEGKLSQDDIVGPKDLLKKRLEELDFKDLKALFLTKLKK